VTYRVTTTEAQAAVMAKAAGQFEQVNSSIQSMMSGLMNQLAPLQSRWVGAGGTSFTNVKVQFDDDMKKISQALSETAEAIRTSGQQYTVSDDTTQQRMTAANHGVSLPL
jgi:WXG100 family type VII secretion target